MHSKTIRYFGYGSLVNRQTRPSTESSENAFLKGWQRAWAHRVLANETDRGTCSSLTIEKMRAISTPNEGISGVVVTMPAEDLPLLDAREEGYERVVLPASDFILENDASCEPGKDEPVFVYVSNSQHNFDADEAHPVLQSYVDCVMAGFEALYGADGLQAFMQTTRGWQLPIDNDRKTPRYPRSVPIDDESMTLFDSLVNAQRLRELGNV